MSTPQGTWRVEVVQRPADFTAHLPAWEELLRHAVEPNVFYEPWMLRPALETLGDSGDLLRVILVHQW